MFLSESFDGYVEYEISNLVWEHIWFMCMGFWTKLKPSIKVDLDLVKYWFSSNGAVPLFFLIRAWGRICNRTWSWHSRSRASLLAFAMQVSPNPVNFFLCDHDWLSAFSMVYLHWSLHLWFFICVCEWHFYCTSRSWPGTPRSRWVIPSPIIGWNSRSFHIFKP